MRDGTPLFLLIIITCYKNEKKVLLVDLLFHCRSTVSWRILPCSKITPCVCRHAVDVWSGTVVFICSFWETHYFPAQNTHCGRSSLFLKVCIKTKREKLIAVFAFYDNWTQSELVPSLSPFDDGGAIQWQASGWQRHHRLLNNSTAVCVGRGVIFKKTDREKKIRLNPEEHGHLPPTRTAAKLSKRHPC